MNWHYYQEGKSVGPVSEEDFTQLLDKGSITPETMVWHQGMQNWQSYSSVTNNPIKLSNTKKKTPQRKWIWFVAVFLILSIAGMVIINTLKMPTITQILNPGNLASIDTSNTNLLSSIRCDGKENIITIPANYAIAQMEVPDIRKQEALDLKSDNKIIELYQLQPSNIIGNKQFNYSYSDVNNPSLILGSGISAISEGSDEFLIGLNNNDLNDLFPIMAEKALGGLSVLALNDLSSPMTVSFMCNIQ